MLPRKRRRYDLPRAPALRCHHTRETAAQHGTRRGAILEYSYMHARHEHRHHTHIHHHSVLSAAVSAIRCVMRFAQHERDIYADLLLRAQDMIRAII